MFDSLSSNIKIGDNRKNRSHRRNELFNHKNKAFLHRNCIITWLTFDFTLSPPIPLYITAQWFDAEPAEADGQTTELPIGPVPVVAIGPVVAVGPAFAIGSGLSQQPGRFFSTGQPFKAKGQTGWYYQLAVRGFLSAGTPFGRPDCIGWVNEPNYSFVYFLYGFAYS